MRLREALRTSKSNLFSSFFSFSVQDEDSSDEEVSRERAKHGKEDEQLETGGAAGDTLYHAEEDEEARNEGDESFSSPSDSSDGE